MHLDTLVGEGGATAAGVTALAAWTTGKATGKKDVVRKAVVRLMRWKVVLETWISRCLHQTLAQMFQAFGIAFARRLHCFQNPREKERVARSQGAKTDAEVKKKISECCTPTAGRSMKPSATR